MRIDLLPWKLTDDGGGARLVGVGFLGEERVELVPMLCLGKVCSQTPISDYTPEAWRQQHTGIFGHGVSLL